MFNFLSRKRRAVCALVIAFWCGLFQAWAEPLSEMTKGQVDRFVLAVDEDNLDLLKTLVVYPLKRPAPLPDVKDEASFVKRYRELFDEDLRETLVESVSSDWQVVGARGVMLNSGRLWLDSEGHLIAINSLSEAEKSWIEKRKARERSLLHPSLKSYKDLVLIAQTENFVIRIDQLQDGDYRYAAWPKGRSMRSRPDLVLKGGRLITMGSGGNRRYQFRNGFYLYSLALYPLGSSDQDEAVLRVHQKRELLLEQPASLIKSAW